MTHLPGNADEIRGLVPAARETYAQTRDTVLRSGVVDQGLKELCFRFLAGAVAVAVGDLAGAARVSDPAGAARVSDPERSAGRERAALEWAYAIAFDADRADDALWARLHALFSEPELVDLGCAIGFELGQQHWRRTIGLPAREDA